MLFRKSQLRWERKLEQTKAQLACEDSLRIMRFWLFFVSTRGVRILVVSGSPWWNAKWDALVYKLLRNSINPTSSSSILSIANIGSSQNLILILITSCLLISFNFHHYQFFAIRIKTNLLLITFLMFCYFLHGQINLKLNYSQLHKKLSQSVRPRENQCECVNNFDL